jgi:hypothetical protein
LANAPGDRQQHIANVYVRHFQVFRRLEIDHVKPLCLQLLAQLQQLGGFAAADVPRKQGAGGILRLIEADQILDFSDDLLPPHREKSM